MAATPWGDSATLRDRRLQPARSASAPEVQRNQRGRMLAAMVACVSERGYAPVKVSDVLELSGVSRRTFYDAFESKRDCFVAALDGIVAMATSRWDDVLGPQDDDWEESARNALLAFAEMVVSQSAAARAALVDSPAAGDDGLRCLDSAIAAIEAATGEAIARSPRGEEMPPEMVCALAGAVRELASGRLRRGREGELPRLMDEVAQLLLSYRPPPEPLRLAVRPPKQSPERLDAADHADRAIRAFSILVAEQGYPHTTIDEVLRKASMSRATFDSNFTDKQDLMAAAIDSACAQTVASALPAFSRAREWPQGVRAAFGSMLNFLASRPALAHLLTVAVYAAGDEAVERRAAGISPLQMLLENNTTDWQHMPPVAYEAIASSVGALLFQTVRRSGAAALPGLAPVCTYLTLSPFIGAEDACSAANGIGTARAEGERPLGMWDGQAGPGAMPFREPLRRTVWKAIAILDARDATPAELANEIGDDLAVVTDYLRQLAAGEAIRKVGERDGEPLLRSSTRGSKPRFHKLSMVSSRQASRMSVEEREELSSNVWGLITADVDQSLREEMFDRRLDRYLTRMPMRLDERGWRELADLHEQMLHASLEIQARNRQRLAESGEMGIPARSVQIAFEVPEDAENLTDGPSQTA
jgi:AcrR family transcriptional regulator